MYSCQYCSKIFKTNKSKNRHERETCPRRPGAARIITPEQIEKLEIKPPEKKSKTSGQGYHCIDCGYSPISKGTPVCPGCGQPLDWAALEGGNG